MKLRLRSFETKETLKIDVPSSCTIHELKQRIAQANPSSSSSSSSSSNSIHLSLNRKDELQSSSPSEDTLQSLGITSGDLIFFTFNPNVFSAVNVHNPQIVTDNSPKVIQNTQSQPNQGSNPLEVQTPQFNTDTSPNGSNPLEVHKAQIFTDTSPKVVQESESVNEAKTPNVVSQWEEEAEDLMEVDEGDYGDVTVAENLGESFSVPGFIRKVFMEELSDDGGRGDKLLVVAVHAVLVESGFVLFDPVSSTKVSGSQFWKNWPMTASRMSLFYTLPKIIDRVRELNQMSMNGKIDKPDVIHSVELKFQSLGKFSITHASLSGGSATHTVTFNEDHLVPFLNVVWANCGLYEVITGNDGGYGTSPEREVFQFWGTVKDGLVLPLLIDLCEKAGLELPPCFNRLPTDLKTKILELLPGVEIAKVSCVSSELQYLASNDELWKKKFVEQFGVARTSEEEGHWKEKFVNYCESRKRRRSVPRPRFLGGPNPLIGPWRPHILGGDYGLLGRPFDITGNPLDRAPPARSLRNHVPRCHLGGHSDNNFA